MYLDLSFKRLGTLLAVVALLGAFVLSTHAYKANMFGSTPYFYTIGVGAEYAWRSFLAMFGADVTNEPGAPAPGILVLTYHRVLDSEDVNNITVDVFREQMHALKDAGWESVTLEEFEAFIAGERELPERSFLLTFDDGAKESFYPVDPILRELGYEAAIFIIVESSKTPESTYYLTPEEIRWMLDTGRWSIGSHSRDGHRPYPADAAGADGIFFADRLWQADESRLESTDEFAARVRDDLSQARSELESSYGVPIDTFAFPLGNETGIRGANNYAEGASVTESIARGLYRYGFIQTNDQAYTLNFPMRTTAAFAPASAFTSDRLRTDFLVHRIHVDYDWSGERLLAIMENALAKKLPFEDDFSSDRGWIPSWGSLELGRNNLRLAANPEMTSADTFLDGSALWDDYSFDASVNWERGYVILLADVLDSKTYHSCAFSEGAVRIQRTVDGRMEVLAEAQDPRIAYGEDAQMGIRVHGSVIECTWDFASIIEDYSRDFSGGIGIQAWDETPGAASLQVSSVIVRPYESP